MEIDYNNTNYLVLSNSGSNRSTLQITWDGPDNDPTTLDPDGLGGVDLTDGGVNSGFHFLIIGQDVKGLFKITVYEYNPSTDYSVYSQILSGINPGTHEDVFIPFGAFTAVGGDGADFTDVGAIILEINNTASGTDQSLDVSLDFFEADSVQREYGDLPVSIYGTGVLSAYHIPRGMRLGNNCDVETTYASSTYANGDDAATVDDEDGVVPSSLPWGNGSGDLEITVRGCSTSLPCERITLGTSACRKRCRKCA
ncbi:MAG: hypothetical protein ACP5NB_12095, partial [Chloroflexia bacterium]